MTQDLTDRQRDLIERAGHLGRERFAERAARYDTEASFPFKNYADLREAGLQKMRTGVLSLAEVNRVTVD